MQVFPMLSNPLVSIAIVTWNRREDVSRAIESCYSQTYKNIEVVVVDNASSDGTYELLPKNYPDIKVIRTHRNLGCCPGRNIAMANCTGDIVFCLDDDGWLDEKCVEHVVMDCQENENVAIIACNVISPGEKDRKTSRELKTAKNRYTPVFMGGGFGIRRGVLNHVGYFPDYFRQGEENYLALKILDAGHKILFDPAAIVYHHWNLGGKGGNDRQIIYLSFRHDLENIKRLLPLNYALPVIAYKVIVNLAKRYIKNGYMRCFFPDLIRVLPILLTDYKEKKVRIQTYRLFTREASRFFKERNE
jgi:GT2 family glycosyltransferase